MKMKETSVTPCHNLNVFLSPLDHFSTNDQWLLFFPVEGTIFSPCYSCLLPYFHLIVLSLR